MVITPIRKSNYPTLARMAVMAAALSFAAGTIIPFSAAAQEAAVSGGSGPDSITQSGPSASKGNARDQSATAAPDAPGAPATEGIDTSDAAAEVTGSEGGGLMGLAVPALLIVVLIAFSIVLWLVFKRSKGSEMPSQRRRGTNPGLDQQVVDSGYGDGVRANGGFGSADPHDLNRKFNMIGSRVDQLCDRMERVEQRLGALGGQGGGLGAAQQSLGGSSLDRRSERIHLPKDSESDYRRAPAPRRPPEAQETAAPPPPSARPEQTSASVAKFVSEVAARFNDAGKPAEHAALAREYHADYYSNERKGDIATLIKSDSDRFWIIPIPGVSGYAALIPGFAIKKSWQRYRQDSSDHPLAHHFKLIRGDKFVVHAAAIVSKDSSGQWQLERPGEVSMLS